MKISLEWIRDYVALPADLAAAQLMHDLTMTTVEVESATAHGSDTVLEIDNKSVTHRPDLWGHYGVARELAAIYRLPLKAPVAAPLTDLPRAAKPLVGDLDARCARFTVTTFANTHAAESPGWLRERLARVGQNSFNLWVDLTNYVMLDTGQPLHAYDAAKLTLPLGVRMARKGERTQLLNGETYELADGVLAIVDAERIVGLAGIMGGLASSVTDGTTGIVLECANFDALSIRRASRAVNLRTDASSRFEKAIDTQRIDLALGLFIDLVRRLQPGAEITAFQDLTVSPTPQAAISTRIEFLEDRLGSKLPAGDAVRELQALGFESLERGGSLEITAPTWRSTGDISGPHDILEEVARLKGYDNFAFVPPEVRLERKALDTRASFERRLRDLLIYTGGMQEIVTYPWSGREFLEAAGIDGSHAPRLHAAPSPDQDTVRPSLVPNLLEAVARNVGFFSSFRIFEMGRVFPGGTAAGDHAEESLPAQPRHLAAALVGPDAVALFREAQGLVEVIPRVAHATGLRFEPANGPAWADAGARIALHGQSGRAGTIAVVTRRARKLAGIKRGEVVIVEIDVDALEALPSRENRFEPLSHYPQADFDISLLFGTAVSWRSIADTAASADENVREVAFVDDYRGKGVPEGRKSITLRLRIGEPGRTLRSEEINAIGDRVRAALGKTLAAEERPS